MQTVLCILHNIDLICASFDISLFSFGCRTALLSNCSLKNIPVHDSVFLLSSHVLNVFAWHVRDPLVPKWSNPTTSRTHTILFSYALRTHCGKSWVRAITPPTPGDRVGYAEAGETPLSQNHLLGVAMTRAQDLMGVQTRGERTGLVCVGENVLLCYLCI